MNGYRDGSNGVHQHIDTSSHHYSHPYAPHGEPSQPLRAHYSSATRAQETSADGHDGASYRQSSGSSRMSSSSLRQQGDDTGPIPAPVVRADYAAPVFKTFQERKRAKEMALRMAAGLEEPIRRAPPLTDVPHTQHHPSVSTMNDHRALPTPPPIQSDTRPRTPSSPRKPTPGQPISAPVRLTTSRPLPSPVRTDTSATHAGPSTPRSPASAFSPVRSTTPILDRSDTISSVKSLDRGMGYGSPSKRALPKPPVAVNTSKSLDRGIPSGIGGPSLSSPAALAEGYSRKTGRKLPSTVTELSEGSDDGLSFNTSRLSLHRQASPEKRPSSPIKSASSPIIPSIVLPPDPVVPPDRRSTSPLPSMNIVAPPDSPQQRNKSVPPSLVETPPNEMENASSPPATFTPLPAISIGDSDDDEVATPNSGIVYGDLPVIAVSSSDAGDVISIQVPDIGNPTVKSPLSRAPPPTSAAEPTRIDPTSAIICAGCSGPIIGRIVSAMDQRWHPQCFRCGECGELLEHVSSYEYQGRPYCHLDYHDKFAHRCHHCKTPIVEPRFITLDDPILGQRYYHELHFFCSECGDPFLDPSKSSAPGTERTRSYAAEEEETNAFVIQKGHAYCERCHLRLHKPKCKGCKRPIPDVAVDAMNGKWHQECFVCVECGNGFANSLFFPKDDKAFCTECYAVMIGA